MARIIIRHSVMTNPQRKKIMNAKMPKSKISIHAFLLKPLILSFLVISRKLSTTINVCLSQKIQFSLLNIQLCVCNVKNYLKLLQPYINSQNLKFQILSLVLNLKSQNLIAYAILEFNYNYLALSCCFSAFFSCFLACVFSCVCSLSIALKSIPLF